MAALRTVWTTLVGLYEETLVLVGGNLAAVALNLPIGLVLFAFGLLVVPSGGDSSDTQWLIAIIAWLIPFLPTPGNVALAALTQVAAGPDVPRFHYFGTGLRTRWGIAARATVVSIVILVALVWNVWFYFTVGTGWVWFVGILWVYGAIFWLSLHIYLLPLLVHVAEPRLFDLYKRAAFIALGHAGYTLLLLLVLLIIGFAAVVFLPVYALVAASFISLAQANALREIRRRHGDLTVEAEEEVGRL
jgi:uncharacterized membrane protein YesL